MADEQELPGLLAAYDVPGEAPKADDRAVRAFLSWMQQAPREDLENTLMALIQGRDLAVDLDELVRARLRLPGLVFAHVTVPSFIKGGRGPSRGQLADALDAAAAGLADLPVAEAAAALAEVVEAVSAGGRLRLIDSDGNAVAALVPLDVLEEIVAAEDEADAAVSDAVHAEGGEPIPLDQVGWMAER